MAAEELGLKPIASLPPGGWRVLRDRLLASPRFQHWAARFPLTRWVARRRAKSLFDLCAGFVYSQVLYACIALHLFDHLAQGAAGAAALAPHLGLTEEAALRLLEAARSLGLVERRGRELYGLGALGAALRGNPGAMAMIEHHALLYADLADPVALLRGRPSSRRLASYWPYAGTAEARRLTGPEIAPYTALMARSQAMIAAEILDAYPMHRHRCLLDVGGGEGAFLAAAALRAPQLRLMLFDLPAVAERARLCFAESGLASRATVHSGDFHVDPLPRGADILSLVRVIHDHDDAAALRILVAARRALTAQGTLILAEPMAETRGAESIGAAYFGFYLLAMGSGRPRRVAELETLLRSAGFGTIRRIPTRMPMLTQLLVAHPGAEAAQPA
jgi:demethylspheroidene O-methyltransferase